MVTIATGGQVDWALLASLGGNAGLLVLAFLQYLHAAKVAKHARDEAALSRRPVLELSLVRAINETWMWVIEDADKLAITIEVRIENVGDGAAHDVEVTARGGLSALAMDRDIEGTRAWISEDVHLRGSLAYLPPHAQRLLTLQDFVELDAVKGRAPGTERMHGFAVDASFADAYDKRHAVFAPLRQWVVYTGLPIGPE